MDTYFVVTGAPGSGKTTILGQLARLGVGVVDEPARQVLAEQRSIGGSGLPERDARLFTELLLSRALHQHRQSASHPGVLLFDRGLPDVVGYARLFAVPSKAAESAARQYRYNRTVFFAPAREEIYRRDDERRMNFHEAEAFGEAIRAAYEQAGYELVALPHDSPAGCARFLLEQILLHTDSEKEAARDRSYRAK